VRTVINRLENEPINVPRQMVQSLDVLCMQGFANVEGERVRRNRELAEIDGIDERTGELDYSTAFEWTPEGDGHDERGSEVTETIREGQGWSRTDLLRELKRRQDFLDALREHGVEDYRRFTAAVKAYYADPERAVADVEAASRVDDADGTDAETGTRVRKSSEPGEPDEPGDDRPTGERVVDRSVDEPADEPTDTRTADRGPEADPAGARSGADDADRDTDRPDADFGDGR
jgi:flagellar protein FlaI